MADPAPRTLVWLGREANAEAFFWHETAPAARAMLLTDHGAGLLSLTSELPVTLAMRTVLPRSVELAELSQAIAYLAGLAECARRPLILAGAGAVSPRLAAAAIEAVTPDAISGLPARTGFVAVPAMAEMPPLLARPSLVATVRQWLAAFRAGVETRAMQPRAFYPVAHLCAPRGLSTLDIDAAMPVRHVVGRTAAILVPRHGDAMRLMPHLVPGDPSQTFQVDLAHDACAVLTLRRPRDEAPLALAGVTVHSIT